MIHGVLWLSQGQNMAGKLRYDAGGRKQKWMGVRMLPSSGWAFCIPVSGATLLSRSSLLHGGTVQDLRNCSSRALWRLCGLQSTSGLQGNSLTLTSKCLQYGMATAAWRTRIERRDAPTESNAQLPYCFNQAVARGEPKGMEQPPSTGGQTLYCTFILKTFKGNSAGLWLCCWLGNGMVVGSFVLREVDLLQAFLKKSIQGFHDTF